MAPLVLYEGKHLRLVRSERWEYVERIRVCGVVVVTPITIDDQLLFIEQIRPAVGRPVIEFPGGLAGDYAMKCYRSRLRGNCSKKPALSPSGWLCSPSRRPHRA